MKLRKCPVCGGKLRSEAFGCICYDCQGFIDMQGVFHEHKEQPFMPPQTNADRIRAMSDYEMATDLLDMFQEICEDGVPSKEWMLHWLKQPAEGE